MIEFGDIEADDSYDASSTPNARQVARRIHEIRAYLDKVTGTDHAANYDELTPKERELADALASAVIEWLVTHEPDNAESVAQQLHNVRRYLSNNTPPTWDDLPEDQRSVGVALMEAVIEWLHREGSI